MFLIAAQIEVDLFPDMVNNRFVKSILIPSQTSFFWVCYKGFSLLIVKPHFTKETLTVLGSALEILKVGAVSNPPSIKTDIFIPHCSNYE